MGQAAPAVGVLLQAELMMQRWNVPHALGRCCIIAGSDTIQWQALLCSADQPT